MGGHQPSVISLGAASPADHAAAAGLRAVAVRPLTREQFIYQPALERTLRAGVARYPNVEVLLGHECTGLDQDVGIRSLNSPGW